MWKYIKRDLPFAVLAALFMVGEVLMDLVQPGIMRRIVDDGVLGLETGGKGNLELIGTLGLRMIGLVLFGGLCGSLNNVFTHISSQNIGNEMRKDAFRRIMSFSFPQLDRFGPGSLVTRVTNDITQVQNFVSLFVRGLIRTGLLTFGSMYCMFRLNREFGAVVLCAFPFVTGCIILCLWKANPLFSKLQEQLDTINAVMQEDVSGIRIIKEHINLTVHQGETVAIMGATGCGKTTLVNLIPRFYDVTAGAVLVDGVDVREYRQQALREKVAVALQKAELFTVSIAENISWGRPGAPSEAITAAAETAQADGFIRSTSDSLTRAGIKTDIFSGVMGPVMNCIGNIGFVIIAAFGGYFSVNGLISVGVISAFIVYAKQFSRPINELAQIYGQLQTAVAGAERVFAVLDERDEDKSGTALKDGPAAVSFRQVQFSYVPGHPVIRDFTLTVPAGKKVALVGATGSGKTTLVNLLMRFYDIDSGNIFLDGQDIREISRDDLRRNAAIVLQDTVLFSDTVLNNLKYGGEHASMEDVERAVYMSRCDELIQSLPQGWDTVLSKAGESVSQGQRQLLAIARAFVADPRILILDEATSNVDTRTERAIQEAMQKIMENRTSIVIAHRLSTIRDADLIVVMDQGRIVECGDHGTLLAQRGKYYELYMTQYAGFAT